jgi:hypothetical protein
MKTHWPSLVTSFWVKREIKTDNLKALAKPYLNPFLVASALYLLIGSGFVYFQHDITQGAVTQQGAEIKAVLNVQSDISRLQQQLEELDVSSDTQAPLWQLWQVLGPLYEQGVTVKFIRYNDGKIYLSAESVSSSTTLEYLLDSPLVSGPEFTTSVRKMKQSESYIIRFSLVPRDSLAMNDRGEK